MVFKSREIVKCGYYGCSFECQRRFLKRHTIRKHKGCPMKEYNCKNVITDLQSAIKVAGLLETRVSGIMEEMDASDQVPDANPEPSTSSDVPLCLVKPRKKKSEKNPKSLQHILKGLVTLAYEEKLRKEIEATENEVSNEDTPMHCNAFKAVNSDAAAAGLLQNIKTDTSSDMDCYDGASASDPEPSTSSDVPLCLVKEKKKEEEENTDYLKEVLDKFVASAYEEKLKTVIAERKLKVIKEKQCRSLEALKDEADGLLEIVPEANLVLCKPCVSESSETYVKKYLNTYGTFAYDFSQGTSFLHGRKLPKDFLSLKFKIDRHFRSVKHRKNCVKHGIVLKHPNAEEQNNIEIAMRVLRTAYHVLKSSQPHKVFCNLIHLQVLNGLQMGDINHSSSLINKLRDAFHDEIMLYIRTELLNPELLNDLNLLVDLTHARSCESIPMTATLMHEAFDRLQAKNIVAPDFYVSETCCEAVCTALREYRPHQDYISNEELFKFAWDNSCIDVRHYMRLVARLWLINPCASTAEPLTIVMKEVFGDHRNLEHPNAIKELIIKWNGPALNDSNPLLEMVQRKLQVKFTRTSGRCKNNRGTVLTHWNKK